MTNKWPPITDSTIDALSVGGLSDEQRRRIELSAVAQSDNRPTEDDPDQPSQDKEVVVRGDG